MKEIRIPILSLIQDGDFIGGPLLVYLVCLVYLVFLVCFVFSSPEPCHFQALFLFGIRSQASL